MFFVAGILILGCAVAGCVQPAQERAEAELCRDLEALGVALQNLQSVNATSSVGDIRDAQGEVQSARENVRSSAGRLADIRVNELTAAYEELSQVVQNIPNSANVVEIVQTIRPKVQAGTTG
ncbi:hypothetical protein ABH15_00850 [Methanoculleus taiwanensis]|uniref:Uncharacterized protein n=2 Tax=Methanoculleus taiwanensis TaxID=1550565 RepID=A0A498H4F5_9EURY|nr:hypothetical protein ABH15_00850 [Methanoculleus taiwanensis]